jgi:Phosphopantetheine attachment site
MAGAVELRNALNDKFGIELSPTVTLDYPSVAALASHIAAQLPQAGSAEQDDDDEQQAGWRHDHMSLSMWRHNQHMHMHMTLDPGV